MVHTNRNHPSVTKETLIHAYRSGVRIVIEETPKGLYRAKIHRHANAFRLPDVTTLCTAGPSFDEVHKRTALEAAHASVRDAAELQVERWLEEYESLGVVVDMVLCGFESLRQLKQAADAQILRDKEFLQHEI